MQVSVTICWFTIQISPQMTILCFMDRGVQEVDFFSGQFHCEFYRLMATVQIFKELVQFFLTMGPYHHEVVQKSLIKYGLFIITIDKFFLKISHEHICQAGCYFSAHGSPAHLEVVLIIELEIVAG